MRVMSVMLGLSENRLLGQRHARIRRKPAASGRMRKLQAPLVMVKRRKGTCPSQIGWLILLDRPLLGKVALDCGVYSSR